MTKVSVKLNLIALVRGGKLPYSNLDLNGLEFLTALARLALSAVAAATTGRKFYR